MTGYHFVTTSELDAPVERVWAALEAVHSGPGARLVVRTPLRLAVDLAMASQYPAVPRTLVLRAGGDLAGVATWTLAEREGATSAAWTWDVRAARGWARLLGPLARPLVRRGHARLTRRVAADLAGLLATGESLGAS